MCAWRAAFAAGADPLKHDHEGKSALDLARHFGNTGVMGVLEGAQEQAELLSLKDLGIGTHRGKSGTPLRGEHCEPSISPNSVSSPLSPIRSN